MVKKRETANENHLEEKQSARYTFLGFIVLLLLIAVAYFVVKQIGIGAVRAADWLSKTASKLDAVIVVALISAAVSIIGVVLSSIVGKRIEYKKTRESYLAQRREKPYGEFVAMFYRVHQNAKEPGSYTKEEMVADMLSFSKELTLWGSKRVVEKWVKYRKNGANPDASNENLFLLEEIMNEMRNDLGVKRVKQGALLSFIINGAIKKK